MTQQTLLNFETLANYRNFSKAAEVLFISQSALSHSIRSLEDELGVQLFERRGAQSLLTEQGKELLNYTRQIFNEQENLKLALSERRDPFQRPIRITVKMGFYPLRKLLLQFQQRYPEARFSVYQQKQGRMAFFPWELTFFNCDTPQLQPGATFLYEEPFLLLIHREHPLNRREVITLHNLGEYPGLQLLLSKALLDRLAAVFEAAGVLPNYVVTTDYFHLVIRLAEEKKGWALLPAVSMAPFPLGKLCLRRVEGVDVRRWVYLKRNPDRYYSQAMKLFLEFSRDYFAGKSGGIWDEF